MPDSGPHDHRLLARLLEAGTLVLDEADMLRFASATACSLLGADDEAQLRRAWAPLAAQLGIPNWPRRLRDGEAFHGRADVVTARGPRSLRYELHVVDATSGYRALLVRDRALLSPGDTTLLLASEAEANRHVLAGLVHAAKGPLNNFNLTLSLLARNVARADAGRTDEAQTKRTRYIGVLQSEALRLAACIDEINALTLTHVPAREALDLAALSQQCARVLRHGATMREVNLDLDVPSDPVEMMGDPRLVRLALLSFAINVIELTAAGGRVAWRVSREPDNARVRLTTSQPRLPRALVDGLFRLSCTGECAHPGAIAARVIIEAQAGEVIVHDGREGHAGLALRFPLHI
jgi:signal transduction histidine kinase